MRARRRFRALALDVTLALALAVTGGAVSAQETAATGAQPVPPPAANPVELVYVTLTTSAGAITLALDKTHAPLTTANFLKYVDTKRMDGALFYRAMHMPSDDGPSGLLQGGVRDAAKQFPPVAHEPTSKTGILHKSGTISMARFAPGSATSDFLILLSDMPSLDAQKGNAGQDPGAGFAAFGHVVAGMDVVRAIWDMPRSTTKGEGVMKGDILENEVRIVSARRVPALVSPAAAPAS